jgi:hypothetical protein
MELYQDRFYLGDLSKWSAFIHEELLKEVFGPSRRPWPKAVLRRSRFPYQWQEHGTGLHYILWFSRLSVADSNASITEYLKLQLPHEEFVWYQNPNPTVSSVGAPHYHVFVRVRG